MSIVCRVEKDRNFTVMHNFHLRDKNISNKAKGLLSLVLSLPEDWDYSVKGLVTLSSDGYDSIKTTLKELEASGYLVRERNRDEYGHLKEMIYCFYELPQQAKTEDELLGKGTPTEGNPPRVNPLGEGTPTEGNPLQANPLGEGSPREGKPIQANPHQLNTNSTNILNKQNKDTFSLTSRTREGIADELSLIASIENQIERHLSVQEKQICDKWCKSGTDLKLIDLAVKDNLFRGRQFKLDYVDATLVSWKRRGVKDVNAARKIILDKHVENLSTEWLKLATGTLYYTDSQMWIFRSCPTTIKKPYWKSTKVLYPRSWIKHHIRLQWHHITFPRKLYIVKWLCQTSTTTQLFQIALTDRSTTT